MWLWGRPPGVENPDAARGFVGREVLAAPVEQVGFSGCGAGMEFDGGGGNFAFLLVGQAEGGGAGDGGMGHDGLFQFADVDRVAARLDDILHAADEADQAEAIARGQVAGAQPAIGGEQVLVLQPCLSNSAGRGRGGESGTRRLRRRGRGGHLRRRRGF